MTLASRALAPMSPFVRGAFCSLVLLVLLGLMRDASAQTQRHRFFISDLHLGAGRDAKSQWHRTEDFRWHGDFGKFLKWAGDKGGQNVDLIFLGDVFELWQSPTMNCTTDINEVGCAVPDCNEKDTDLGCSEKDAVARIKHTLSQHQDFVRAINAFTGRGDNRVYLVPGNHDAALLFEKVRDEVLSQFPNGRVRVEGAGYWLSPDGSTYADHGHQADLLNKFGTWPSPFIVRDGVAYMRKPWGENMVQQFYNQYEQVYPIIDNLADERTGVQYAISQAGLSASVTAVEQFFRFLLFQQSFRQALDLLGDEKPREDGKPVKWNITWVKSQPSAFFVEVLKPVQELHRTATTAAMTKTLEFNASALTEEEINVICIAKDLLKNVQRCERVNESGGDLAALAQGFVYTDEQIQADYLRAVLPKVALKPNQFASVYVYGHTHKAVVPKRASLGEIGTVTASITVMNTGAFQRTASTSQIDDIMASPYKGTAKSPLDLQPEQLPHCYSFVWIEPYQAKPVPTLWRWAENINANGNGFKAEKGTCVSRAIVEN